jgi:hypothetical protein
MISIHHDLLAAVVGQLNNRIFAGNVTVTGNIVARFVRGRLDQSQYCRVAFSTARGDDNVLGSSFNNPVYNGASDTSNVTKNKVGALFV